MPQPYSYGINVEDPTKSILSGLQAGYNIQALQQEALTKKLAIAQALQQQQQQREMQADLTELSKNPTVEGIGKAIIKYPQLSEHYKRAVDILSPEEKQARLSEAQQAHAAILSGQPEVAADYLAKQAEAHRNNGDEKTAKSLEGISEQIRQNPNAANTSIGTFIASIVSPEKYVETFSAYEKAQREKELHPGAIEKQWAEIRKLASDAGLSDAKANESAAMAKKLGVDTAKTMIEMEQLKKSGGIDPEKKFDFENKLRTQYVDRTKGFVAAKDAFSKIVSSADDNTGAGDIALVTSFMKMLDPGSVVRETEFATARDTAGLLTQLQNKAQQIKGGSFLDPEQRRNFKNLAKKYMDAASAQEKTVRDSLMRPVKEYGLSEGSVFGGEPVVPKEETTSKTITVDY